MLKRLIKYVPIKSVRHHLKANYIDVPLQQEIAKHLDETYVKPFIEMHYQSVVDNYNNHAFDMLCCLCCSSKIFGKTI